MDKDFWSQVRVPEVKKTHTVTVEGKTVEVDLDTKLKVQKLGEDKWTWQDGKLVEKPKPKASGVVYAQLKDSEEGYELLDGHAYWPSHRSKNGKAFTYE